MPSSECQADAVGLSASKFAPVQTANALSDALCSICLSRLTISCEQAGQFFDCEGEADMLQVCTETLQSITWSAVYVSIVVEFILLDAF